MVSAGDVLAKIPRETTKTKDITGGLPRVVELFEARKPRETAVISEIDGIVKHGGIVKGQRKIIIVPDEPGAEPREYALPRGVHVNVQEGERVRAGEPLMDGPSQPARHPERARREGAAGVPRERNPGGLPAAGRQHQRQAHRDHRAADDAVGEDRGCRRHRVPRRRADRQVPVPRRERARDHGGRTSGAGPAAAARHHEGVALDRLVHLGGVVPGNDARAHRGVHLRQGRSPARPEGERHDGPADSGRHRASSTTGTCRFRRTSRRRRRRRRSRATTSSSWSATWSTSSSPRKRSGRGRGIRSNSRITCLAAELAYPNSVGESVGKRAAVLTNRRPCCLRAVATSGKSGALSFLA